MKNNYSINYTVKNKLCTGCGICEDVCPTNSITIKLKNGVFQPHVNNDTCINKKGCSKCIKVCPGIGIDLKKYEKRTFNSSNEDKYIGLYDAIYTGYSNEYEIRYHSASGGLVSQFLIYLLDKNIIDGAVVTGFNKSDNITPLTYIAKSKEDIINARSSKYCPVSMNKIGNEIKNSNGKYIIVGLPCHIQGFRKREQCDKRFKENVFGYFSIFCSSTRTFNARDYLIKKNKIDYKKIKYFAFRDEGCLGSLYIKSLDKNVKIPYVEYYGNLRSFFKTRRCLSCIDHYGALADVCFGDIHIQPYIDDKIGINSVIIKNQIFNYHLKQAAAEGCISLNSLEAKLLNKSQKTMLYSKMRKVKALMRLNFFRNGTIPKYDVVINESPSIKDYLSVISINIQRFIGSHRSLWFIISITNSRK